MSGVNATTTEQKVAYLGSSGAYGDPFCDVGIIETHMSWVFLAGDTVYKLKKPVAYPFLDFTTIAAREANCKTEVRVNRRLAPEVYLGVVALTAEGDGSLALEGAGRPVDWLVKMRRLPAERMLDRAIEAGTVSGQEVERVAGLLAHFYQQSGPAEISASDYIERFASEHAVTRDVLQRPAFDLPRGEVAEVLDSVEHFIDRRSVLLGDRVAGGFIVEGHGDLRPEHICLLEPPFIIDCLEFNELLRLIDPFDELAFLALECDRLGAGWVGHSVQELCAETLDDHPPEALVAFYTVFRATLRARLALAHLLDPVPRDPDRWEPLARQYLVLAKRAGFRMGLRGGRRSTRPHGNA